VIWSLTLAALAGSLVAQSIQSLSSQIQRTPTASLYLERGIKYMQAGDARQAVADFDKVVERETLNVRALTLRAEGYMKLGRPADAITDLSGCLALAPADPQLYLARAEAYAATGDARRAETDLAEAHRLDPNATLRKKEAPAGPAPNTPAAVPTAEEAKPLEVAKPPVAPKPAAVSSGPAEQLYQRGRDLINQGKPAEGREQLDAAIRQSPNVPVYYNTRGYAFFLEKDYVRAVADFDQAIALNPNYLNAMHNRALAHRGAGDTSAYNADREREIEISRKLGVRVQ
jgi:tetratricopeptide (TPR) repeat protein